jgi:predicted nucleotidyltransferase
MDMLPEDLEIVEKILKKHLAGSTKVWVFGSRAKNTAKKFSDLDLVMDAGKPLAFADLAAIRFDFEESPLPYKVDVVDWHAISESFQKLIQADRILLLP